MGEPITRLDVALKAAGVPIVGVSPKGASYQVYPPDLQAQAQPIIDSFDPNAPTILAAELTATVNQHLDAERIFSAIVWVVIDTFAAPATIAKYNAARTKIIAAFQAQPWKP